MHQAGSCVSGRVGYSCSSYTILEEHVGAYTAEPYLRPLSSEASRQKFISWQQILQQLLENIEALHAEQAIIDNEGFSDNQHHSPYPLKVTVMRVFTSGQPFLQTDMQTAYTLLHTGYNRKEIAAMAGISEWTIRH